MILNLEGGRTIQLTGLPAGVTRTITNLSTANTVYYGGQNVSPSSNAGSISPGLSATLDSRGWYLVSPSGESQVDDEPSIQTVGSWATGVAQIPTGSNVSNPSSEAWLPPIPIINRGLPVTGSEDLANGTTGPYAASNAVSSNHGLYWRSVRSPNGGAAVWIAQDLRSVPGAAKSKLWFVMRAPQRPVYTPPPAAMGSQSSSSYITLPRNFTLQAHASSGSLPASGDSGWTTLATVTDNRRSDLIIPNISLSGYNWFRVNVTAASGVTGASDDVSFRFELRDVRNGALDVIGVFGDSIETEVFIGRNIDNSQWPIGGMEDQLEYISRAPAPIFLDVGSLGGQTASGALSTIADYLNGTNAPGVNCNYILLCLGTNDVNGTSGAFSGIGDAFVQTWIGNMQSIINYITQTLGKSVILPHVNYRNDAGYSAANAAILNQAIDQLITSNPQWVFAGPDVYSFFQAHQNALRDGIHPGWDISQAGQLVGGMLGYQHLQRLWVDSLVNLLYDPASVSSSDRVDVNVLANPIANTGFAAYAASTFNRFTDYVSDAGTVGDFIEFEVNLKSGWYWLDTYVVGGPAQGALTASLVGPQGGSISLGTVDCYQVGSTDLRVVNGPAYLPVGGRYYLRYTTAAKNSSSSSTAVGIRWAQLRRG